MSEWESRMAQGVVGYAFCTKEADAVARCASRFSILPVEIELSECKEANREKRESEGSVRGD